MKLDSKYFDSIRLSRKGSQRGRGKKEAAAPVRGVCQWKGCDKPARHKAPCGRGRDGEFFVFCLEHVRQYNASYNYFDGMSDAEVAKFQKDAMTGHRPTWKMGDNATPQADEDGRPVRHGRSSRSGIGSADDPHGLFEDGGDATRAGPAAGRRKLKPLERKSLENLHLDARASKAEIKAKFKALVKLHHPDANGGDTRSEDKLREIIQAYNYLKQAGLV